MMTEHARRALERIDAYVAAAGTTDRGDLPLVRYVEKVGVSARLYRRWCVHRGVTQPAVRNDRVVAEYLPHILDINRGEVIRLLEKGQTRGQVGTQYGISKNAVISWLFTRGIKIDPPKQAQAMQWSRVDKPSISAVPLGVTHMPAPSPNVDMSSLPSLTSSKFPEPLDGVGVHFVDATKHQCQRPLWDHSKVTGNVCGHPVKASSRYCEGCHGVLWLPLPKRASKKAYTERSEYLAINQMVI
jgi:hypothetical protein